jgi:hypothetical protein
VTPRLFVHLESGQLDPRSNADLQSQVRVSVSINLAHRNVKIEGQDRRAQATLHVAAVSIAMKTGPDSSSAIITQ